MKGIDIDVDSATAWVEAGVTVKELDDVTCPLDLAAVNGSCTDVGVIGLILGGGFGFLSRTKGLAIDNCLQMEIVTATGELIVASPQSHEQLFWALRGAGHVGYGVIVKVQVKLHKLHKEYIGGKGNLLLLKICCLILLPDIVNFYYLSSFSSFLHLHTRSHIPCFTDTT